MMAIKQYFSQTEMIEVVTSSRGDYVKTDDYEKLHAELIEAKRKYESVCIERNELEVENMRLTALSEDWFQKLAGELPIGFNVELQVENGYGEITLFDNSGDDVDLEIESYLHISEVMNIVLSKAKQIIKGADDAADSYEAGLLKS